jgi:Spy/CpxP family protein refolding chaperone
MRFAFCIAAVVCAVTFSTATAKEIDNPQYLGWKDHEPGSSATHKGTMSAMGHTMDMEVQQKLVEINDERAIVETTSKVSAQGFNLPPQTQRQTIPARVDEEKPDGQTPADLKWREGEEEIEVAGEKFKCKVYEATTTQQGAKMNMTVWHTEKVPGGTVRLKAVGEGEVKSEFTLELVKYEAK